ncbi:MAG TPA: hypothetical protein VHZ51_17260 [Ktedonobacteraceae bacterium]|nr:hypothetical protein [Ktedonobacteraceae bacterium]
MGTNPYQDQNSDRSNQYGGYSGYTPQNNPAQPYNYGTEGDPNYQYGQQQQYRQQQQQQQQQQQYDAYQPPQSATRRGYSSTSTNTGSNVPAAISYIGIFVTGIFFLLTERRNQFIRFCAAQSTIIFGSAFIITTVLRLIGGLPIIGFFLGPIFGLIAGMITFVAIVLWIFLIVQAYRGVKVKIPIAGDYAERWAQRH